MKRLLAVFGLLLGFVALSHAGTPQENGQQPFQAASYSATSILASSASIVPSANLTVTVATPTVINSGGQAINGRNCFTRFIVQMSTGSVFTIADNATTKWTLYGIGLGTTGVTTLSLPEDHLGPWCTAVGDQTVFTITSSALSLAGNSQSINVEGYVTYGGTNNAGPMQ